MKKLISVMASVLLLGFISSSFAVMVTIERNSGMVIETELYELFWSEDSGSHGMGYTDITFKDAGKLMDGGELYHDLDYGGRIHWGAMIDDDTEILEEDAWVATVKYVSHDGKWLQYTCIATYWELLPFFKHEVTVTNDGAEGAAWPMTGYDPLLIPGVDLEGDLLFDVDWQENLHADLNNRSFPEDLRGEFEDNKISLSQAVSVWVDAEDEQWLVTDRENKRIYHVEKDENELKVYDGCVTYWNEPIPHIVYWNGEGFGGIYASTPKARPRFGDWQGKGDMIRLDHGMVATQVERRTTSPTLVYYLGFGVGGEAEAHALATQVMESPSGKAVKLAGKLSTTWSAIKTSYRK